MSERPLYVARPAEVAALVDAWETAKGGSPRFLRLQAPFGGGRRALSGELQRRLAAGTDDVLLWRVACVDSENGVQWLLRMYGGLVGAIATDVLKRGKVEMILSSALPSQPKRVQGWYQSFIEAIKEAKPDAETGQIQLKIPQDNPLVALVEVASAISRKLPIVLDLQHIGLAHTVLLAQFLEAMQSEAANASARMLALIHDEPEGEAVEHSQPMPLRDLFARKPEAFPAFPLAPWGAEDAAAYLESKSLTGNAARIAEIAGGRPGFIAELVEILEACGLLASDLEGVSFASLVPMTVDEDELEVPEAPAAEGERRHATKDDAGRVAFLAALLGHTFPSSLVAEMGGFDRESVDDLLDAMEDLFEEVQFSEQMGTWLYRFTRGSWRDGILAQHASEEGQGLARGVALFMERYLAPRGVTFIARAARIYAENAAPRRADAMRALALTQDAADSWGMAYEMLRYFDDISWPDALRRSVYTTLLDHLASGGALQVADRVHADVTAWATQQEDRELLAWLLLNGSKIDARRQDFYRARDRARDALKAFEALSDTQRVAECHAHLAQVELADGNPTAALEAAEAAMQASSRQGDDGRTIVAPAIFAQAELTRGAVARRGGQLDEAIQHFRRANEAAGQTGLAALALDAGIALGESLVAKRDLDQADQVLRRLVTAASQLQAFPRERAAAELLAQVSAARKDLKSAVQLGQRVLQLSQGLRLAHAIPVDLFNLGVFLFAQNKPAEALPFFKQSAQRLGNTEHPIRRDLAYYTGIAALSTGDLDGGRPALQSVLPALRSNVSRDPNKLLVALERLAAAEAAKGSRDDAKAHHTEAVGVARTANLKDQRRELQKRLEQLG